MNYEQDPGWQYLRISREQMIQVSVKLSELTKSAVISGTIGPLRLEEELLGSG
jgi:hypothetical protein